MGDAAQLSRTSGPEARRLRSWIAWANSSLPVPVSPWMMIVLSVRLTVSTCFSARRSAGLAPTIRPKLSS